MKFRLSTLILSLAVAMPAAAGQLYKWTDANGRVQYSDTPPATQKAQPVRQSNISSSSSADTAPASTAEQEQAFQKRRTEAAESAEKQAKDAVAKDKNEQQCRQARGYLRGLDNGGRISETNEKGDREYYDQTKINSERERVQNDIDKYCQ